MRKRVCDAYKMATHHLGNCATTCLRGDAAKPPQIKSPSWVSISLSQSSPANSVRSEVEELLPRATTSNTSSWRSLSRTPSSRSRKAPKLILKAERQTLKADSINDMSVGTRAPVTKPQTVWSTDDPYLPRAKPPSPLKPTKHQRNRSEYNEPPPDSTTSSRPSTSHNKYSRQSPESHSTASHSLPSSSSLGMPILDISSEHRDGPIVQHALTRSSTRLSMASEASDDTGITFAPIKSGSRFMWKPPTNWAGPSTAAPVDKDKGSKPVGRRPFTRKKSTESCSQGKAPAGLNRTRSLNKLKSVRSVCVGEPEKHISGVRSGSLSSGGTVEIQCYENHGWQEKPVADVIPMLRGLKIK